MTAWKTIETAPEYESVLVMLPRASQPTIARKVRGAYVQYSTEKWYWVNLLGKVATPTALEAATGAT